MHTKNLSEQSHAKIKAMSAANLQECFRFFTERPHTEHYKSLKEAMDVYQNAHVNARSSKDGVDVRYDAFADATKEYYEREG
jgi:hypothetical protein